MILYGVALLLAFAGLIGVLTGLLVGLGWALAIRLWQP